MAVSPAHEAAVVREVTRENVFWSTVAIGEPDACWPWQGYINKDGYGEFKLRGVTRLAHELALTFTTGEVRQKGLETCHSCSNRPCCNPAHLRFDTRQSNMADAVAAGTMPGRPTTLTPELVVQMREQRAAGATNRSLAQEYGVTLSMVSLVVRGRRWRNVGGPIDGGR